ncbi:MAG: hypothetical protein DI556_02890 [Rhodovulum sulfidophilum]|uniref:Lipoprotein n=1 Tax=Rhodovulum sulfidophilum TaxID=35806 RepID=A0A2W5Q5F5_RHOSU|nr:MAG: hypothetical protein DI556_02890 [Rhodovulum sulfidophilum]
MRKVLTLTGVAALFLAGCSGMTTERTAASGDTVALQATVESVDQATRHLVLVGPDGGRVAFVAGPEVRNLAQVEAGDTVTVAYHDSVVLSMAAPDAPQGTVAAAARAPQGARPGGGAAVATDVVVTVISYDANSGFATFRTDDGVVHRATVPPELRTFAERTAPGSRVLVSMTEAVAVSVTEG